MMVWSVLAVEIGLNSCVQSLVCSNRYDFWDFLIVVLPVVGDDNVSALRSVSVDISLREKSSSGGCLLVYYR